MSRVWSRVWGDNGVLSRVWSRVWGDDGGACANPRQHTHHLRHFGISRRLDASNAVLDLGDQRRHDSVIILHHRADRSGHSCHGRHQSILLPNEAQLLRGLSRLHRALPGARVVGGLQELAHDAGVARVDAFPEAPSVLAHTGHVEVQEQLVDVVRVHVDACHHSPLAEPNSTKSKIKRMQI